MNPNSKIIISGGGSGGHIFPAIAIADAIKEKQPDADILFVGAKGKMEMEKVPKAGYPIQGLWISGFHRQLTLRNLLFPLKLLSSLLSAWRIIRRFKPDVVVGVGGFASGPLLEVASRRGFPTLIQEQNSYAGVTNRLLAKKVDKACVAYEGMERFFPADKLVLTGNPVRKALQESQANREEGASHFGLDPKRPILFVFGGSLGARSLNLAMAANAGLLKERPEVQMLWQYGQLYEEQFGQCETARLPNVQARPFIDRMDLAYAMADVIICRSGALTISELCFVGKPAIFIPSPNVAEDHQSKNAQALVDAGAAWVVRDEEAKALAVVKALELLNDEPSRKQLGENIRKLAMPNAAARIAEEVLKLAHQNSKM
ncbi:MAG: undecaprenyldiphospho-muramoylpentapeptide beta-N-acetylglucosaminyltransferase [Phaeodactylibacter sp.]|nr:undecaprenyldiphospho-muramoylpentapeptide beta-N-acetylglucosaminyltransferase [Phaeodactylibacter sp.]